MTVRTRKDVLTGSATYLAMTAHRLLKATSYPLLRYSWPAMATLEPAYLLQIRFHNHELSAHASTASDCTAAYLVARFLVGVANHRSAVHRGNVSRIHGRSPVAGNASRNELLSTWVFVMLRSWWPVQSPHFREIKMVCTVQWTCCSHVHHI
jgi:hypothetical protein